MRFSPKRMSRLNAGRWLSPVVAALASLASCHAALAQDGWSGNFARDPGFEEDFVNLNAEGHVISYKGDWFYNQRDLVPDYWTLSGDWVWNQQGLHGRSLKLAEGASATQNFIGAVVQGGGTSHSPGQISDIVVTRPERYVQPWRATVWCRGGGSVRLGPAQMKKKGRQPTNGVAEVTAKGNGQWEQLTIELPASDVSKNGSVGVTLTGPGEFDDLVVQEHLPDTPNLLPNGGFENVDGKGYPSGWSQQKKFDWIGPTYYVWTDWMHFQEENRGPVSVDPLIVHGGHQSLRFDVYPGDEKYVESDFIALNQDQPHVVEVAAYVRADRIKLLDIRCVDQNGANLPSYNPVQPESKTGGTALFGNGTFEWRYVRKLFSMPFDAPVQGIRVRLAARGFNGDTLDDSGTRSYACQSGTVWWDDVRVTERTSTAAELAARGVKTAAEQSRVSPTSVSPTIVQEATLDLGERLYGENNLKLAFRNIGPAAAFNLRLTTILPGRPPIVSLGNAVRAATGLQVSLEAPYRIDKLAGDLKQQGKLRIELLRDDATLTDTTYAFNTWPVLVDFDVARHYSLPEESPLTVALNLGVASATLHKVAKMEIALQRTADGALFSRQTITDLPKAFAATVVSLPQTAKDSYDFKLPTPVWWTDRTNLLLANLDLSELKVWPADNPTRDTIVVANAFDAAGNLLFTDQSDGLCRVAQRAAQPAIESVKIRDDGAVLINGKPRFLTGATHQNTRTNHTYETIAQLGIMGHRLPQQEMGKFESLAQVWKDLNLYALQAEPISGVKGGRPYASLTDAEKQALADFVKAGGMQSIVSINTGGWEANIPETPEAAASHQLLNDWVRKTTGRPVAWSSSGAYNAWYLPRFPYYDIVHAETEMWGPMDFNVIFTPYMKRLRKDPTTWVYLPQLYDNTPYERYRFETYENIIRGSAGVSMIQGIGDPTFNRGLAGELRYLEAPLYSQEPARPVVLNPNVSHKVTHYNGKTYVLATNAGPVTIGRWNWNHEEGQPGTASHDGDSINRQWKRPGGVSMHGFRGLPLPELIQPGDKIVQQVWIDPQDKPDWVALAVRGDGRFNHVGLLGGHFDYETFRRNYGNIFMFSELEHSVWHDIRYVMDDATYARAVLLMGKEWADKMKEGADKGRATVDAQTYKAADFKTLAGGALPAAGKWQRVEIPVEQLNLVGSLVDGFAYLTHGGHARWCLTSLERGGKVVRTFCDDAVGINRSRLKHVRIMVPGLKAGSKVNALFENRTITAEDGGFTDNFEGVDTYGYEAGSVVGDVFGFVKDSNRELGRMMPSGYGYSYGPTAVHIYEIQD